MTRIYLLFTLLLTSLSLSAQDTSEPEKDGVRVTVLGYHDFSMTRPVTDMCMRTSKFRQQMQAIKDLKLNVISLEDFQLWKAGKKEIPDRSVLITIDDGWKAVYTEAYPILKEHGFPFAVYLYTNYIDVGGRSMTSKMIKEMMENGCSVGSHSTSHPSPGTVKSKKRSGSKTYEKFLRNEFGSSKKLLQEKFDVEIDTYVYPGGHFDKDMYPIIDEYKYDYLYTCIPGKTIRSTPNKEIPRYIILGKDKDDYIFRHATTFKASSKSRASAGAIFEKTEHPVSPDSGQKITSRLPTITADLSKVDNIDVDSVEMRIAGMGAVPAHYDSESKTISWTVNRPLRFPTCVVQVRWRLEGEKNFEPALTWTFVVDREATYLPQTK